MACVHMCTASPAASYEGCVSGLLSTCIPVRLFVLVIDHSVSLLHWQHSVMKWLCWYPCLRYTSVCEHLFCCFQLDPSVTAECVQFFLPGCVPLLVLATQVWHCHVITQDSVTALMHLSYMCMFKFSSLQSTNSTHVCFSCSSSCRWGIWCIRGAYQYSCILWCTTCGEHD